MSGKCALFILRHIHQLSQTSLSKAVAACLIRRILGSCIGQMHAIILCQGNRSRYALTDMVMFFQTNVQIGIESCWIKAMTNTL
ncbi:uncharacterized protein BYT42DRAFT_563063, partial [Radiomyces spectabilis]|uniref:uncharacterized protein n=1 Tax=Radiomyces spectabilis TaxID=64574 RepID=UPI00221E8FD0